MAMAEEQGHKRNSSLAWSWIDPPRVPSVFLPLLSLRTQGRSEDRASSLISTVTIASYHGRHSPNLEAYLYTDNIPNLLLLQIFISVNRMFVISSL